MLNISKISIAKHLDLGRYESINSFEPERAKRKRRYLFLLVLAILVGIMFLPWTQNFQAKGYVTALKPESRPQDIPSIISGRIESWYVQEGDFVERGDTIVHISEVKDDYFDPQLLERTEEQLMAKEASVESYMEKVKALNAQIDAMNQNLGLKLEQARNKLRQAELKVTADSIDLKAAQTNLDIAQQQLGRLEELFEQGLKSRTELEARKLKLQEAQAKVISLESKLLSSRNEVINAAVELNSIRADYADKINKAESEKFSALSNMYDAEATVTKLQNQYSNYSFRTDLYYIRAPQDGYITKAVQTGIGQTVKEGEEIVTIVPTQRDLAVEMYVRPINLPLLERGQEVRIQFDGWPAIIFRGWPGVTMGTFAGEIVAIDNYTSENGLYRVLVSPSPDEEWPGAVQIGSGAKTFTLLNEVMIWYEIWRQVNGFPPDYYDAEPDADLDVKKPKIKI